jgi:NCAIR mutase (PurE)-related protein
MLRKVLEKLTKGEISIDEAEKLLRVTAITEVGGIAKLDVNREMRNGFPEIVLAEGKRAEDLAEIALKMLRKRGRAIINGVSRNQEEVIRKVVPEDSKLRSNESARMITVKREGFQVEKTGGKIGILTAGTSDRLLRKQKSWLGR